MAHCTKIDFYQKCSAIFGWTQTATERCCSFVRKQSAEADKGGVLRLLRVWRCAMSDYADAYGTAQKYRQQAVMVFAVIASATYL
jgi:hypothetical protein